MVEGDDRVEHTRQSLDEPLPAPPMPRRNRGRPPILANGERISYSCSSCDAVFPTPSKACLLGHNVRCKTISHCLVVSFIVTMSCTPAPKTLSATIAVAATRRRPAWISTSVACIKSGRGSAPTTIIDEY